MVGICNFLYNINYYVCFYATKSVLAFKSFQAFNIVYINNHFNATMKLCRILLYYINAHVCVYICIVACVQCTYITYKITCI